jgi:hypothetical protein
MLVKADAAVALRSSPAGFDVLQRLYGSVKDHRHAQHPAYRQTTHVVKMNVNANAEVNDRNAIVGNRDVGIGGWNGVADSYRAWIKAGSQRP